MFSGSSLQCGGLIAIVPGRTHFFHYAGEIFLHTTGMYAEHIRLYIEGIQSDNQPIKITSLSQKGDKHHDGPFTYHTYLGQACPWLTFINWFLTYL